MQVQRLQHTLWLRYTCEENTITVHQLTDLWFFISFSLNNRMRFFSLGIGGSLVNKSIFRSSGKVSRPSYWRDNGRSETYIMYWEKIWRWKWSVPNSIIRQHLYKTILFVKDFKRLLVCPEIVWFYHCPVF